MRSARTKIDLPRPASLPSAARRRADRRLLGAVDHSRSILFLDIETTGLSRFYDEVTLVGYMSDGRYDVHIAGDDPAPLLEALATAHTLVTFNGTLFDVPFLHQTFGPPRVPELHIDLRYAARRHGLAGGQKAIERELGIDARGGLEDIDGAQAVLLWHRYLRGDEEALNRLIRYNLADVWAMTAILDHVVDQVEHRDLLIAPRRFGGQPVERRGHAADGAALPDPRRLARARFSFDGLFSGTRAGNAVVVGIDLTGSEKRPTGFCILDGAHATTQLIRSDDEMVEAVLAAQPALVSIDSPLCLPRGRLHPFDDDPGRQEFGIMRICERTLKRRGINVYPALLPSMQRLTARGIALAQRLRALGIPVIESYPGAAQDIMGIPRKGAGLRWLQQGLADFGITGDFVDTLPSHDELDAITSALVGTFHLAGRVEPLGGEGETALIIPQLASEPRALVIGISGRIAAGKTTAAERIASLGFAYTRVSLVIDDEIRARGLPLDRPTRQQLGLELHEERGQAWLCERAVARVGEAKQIVVDGLRWPQDHAYFVERYGNRFVHLHLTAPMAVRSARSGVPAPVFAAVDTQPVESGIDALAALATQVIENSQAIGDFETEVVRIVEHAVKETL